MASVFDSFDRAQLVPAVSMGAVSAHNVRGAVNAALQASGDGNTPGALWSELVVGGDHTVPVLAQAGDFQWRDVADMPIDQPAFYGAAQAPVFSRYVRVYFPGVMYEFASVGEVYVGHPDTLSVGPQPGFEEQDSLPQVRQETDSKMSYVYVIAAATMRGLSVEFLPFTPSERGKAALDAIRRGIWERSLAGAYPVWVVLDDAEDSVVFGRLEMTLSAKRDQPNAQRVQMNVSPLPSYTVGI